MTDAERHDAEREAIHAILGGLKGPVVVELGAYHGEDMRRLREAFPHIGRYVMVEADPRNAEFIRKRVDLTGVEFVEVAIAGRSGVTTFHLCDNSINRQKCSSSIRAPKEHLRLFPWCRFDEQVQVQCLTLDDLAEARGIDRIDLIWADLQGAERDMIAGGAETLKRTKYLFMEADSVEMYEGQATREDLLEMLPGWDIAGEFDYNILLKNRWF